MEASHFIHLNDILRQASERHPITKYDDCRSWFQGSKKRVDRRIGEFALLFGKAVHEGLITTWSEPGDSSHATFWDWSRTAFEKAKELNITLADPLGGTPLFDEIPDFITKPVEMLANVSTDCLDNDLCGHLNRVYVEQVRYVVKYRDKPVAAIVPLVDLEMLKDLQQDTEASDWWEWAQDIRERLGWPRVNLGNEEEE